MTSAVAKFHGTVANLVHVNTAAFGLSQYRALVVSYLPAWLLVSSRSGGDVCKHCSANAVLAVCRMC